MAYNQWVEQIETLRSVNEAMRDNIKAKQKLIDRLVTSNGKLGVFNLEGEMGMQCKCGHNFDTFTYPLKTSGVLLTDYQIDNDIKVDQVYGECRQYDECINCGRIVVRSRTKTVAYLPEA